jgi:hypothetical protein
MKSCIGCKHLVAQFYCKADEHRVAVVDPLTGNTVYRDPRFPNMVFRPRPQDMRAPDGRCGPDRKFFEPKRMARMMPWLYPGFEL